MAKATYLQQIFETVLAIPGMNQHIKIDLRLSRKQILVLSKVIEKGLAGQNGAEDLLGLIPQEVMDELRQIPIELLKKAELTEVNEKLKGFQ